MEKPKLLDQVRNLIRMRHLSHKTEKAYLYYIRDFILFHDKRNPSEMGAGETAASPGVFLARFAQRISQVTLASFH